MSMMISATCPGCGKSGTAPRDAIGRTATCKGCGTKFVVADAADKVATKPTVKAGEPAPARSPVAVIGDPGHGLERVVALLNKLGIKTGKLGEGPTVQSVVAMAGHDGPSEKFRASLITSATHAVRVLGVVYVSVHDDMDMQEMIEDEIRDSVVHFVPGTDPQLPSWRLEDPMLPTTITGLLKSSPDLVKLRTAVNIVPGPKPYVEPKPPVPPRVMKKQGSPIAGPESWRKPPGWSSSAAMKQSMAREVVSLTDPNLEFMIQYFNSSNNRNPENTIAISRLVQALAKLNRGDFAPASIEMDAILQTAGLAKELVSKAYQCRGILRTIHDDSHAAIEDFTAAMEQAKDDMNLAWSLLWRGRAHARAGFREAAGADFQIVAGMEKLKQLPYTEAIRAAAESDLRAVR